MKSTILMLTIIVISSIGWVFAAAAEESRATHTVFGEYGATYT